MAEQCVLGCWGRIGGGGPLGLRKACIGRSLGYLASWGLEGGSNSWAGEGADTSGGLLPPLIPDRWVRVLRLFEVWFLIEFFWKTEQSLPWSNRPRFRVGVGIEGVGVSLLFSFVSFFFFSAHKICCLLSFRSFETGRRKKIKKREIFRTCWRSEQRGRELGVGR